MMYQIVYSSRASIPIDDRSVKDILLHAKQRNMTDGITGMLLFDGYRFLHALEGPLDAVEACMIRIRRDRRHRTIHVERSAAVPSREFGNAAMALMMPDSCQKPDFVKEVMRRVTTVSTPSLQALIIGFASLA